MKLITPTDAFQWSLDYSLPIIPCCDVEGSPSVGHGHVWVCARLEEHDQTLFPFGSVDATCHVQASLVVRTSLEESSEKYYSLMHEMSLIIPPLKL